MKRRLGMLGFLLLVMLLVGSIASVHANQILFQHNDTPESAWHHGFQVASEYIQEHLPEYDVRIYHSGQLAQQNWALILEQTQEGAVHGFVEFPGTYATMDERFFALMLPYLFDGREHWNRFWESPPEVVEQWIDELEQRQDIRIISVWSRPFRGFLNTERPITHPDDLAGITFRVPDMALFIDVFEALGANPIPMSSGEIYTALQMGTIQGEDNSPPTVYTFASYEQANFYTVSEYISDGALISVNAKWWNGLSPEEQAIIKEGFDRAGEFVHAFQTDQFDVAIAAFEASGVEVNFLTAEQKEPFREVLQPIYTKMAGIVGEDGFAQLVEAIDAAR